MHAREQGGPAESRGKGKERRNNERKRRVARSRARDARGERGTERARRAQKHNTATESGAPEGQTKDSTMHHSTHRTTTHPPAHKNCTGTKHTAQTHTCAHSTWTADPGSPPRRAGSGGRGSARTQTPLATVEGHPPPQGQPPTRHASQMDSAGPPHPHTRAHSTLVADPDSPPRGRAARGGGAPELGRPSQQRKAARQGTPFRHPHSAQRQLRRAHAVGPVLGPHAQTNRTRDRGAAEPRLPAPRVGR